MNNKTQRLKDCPDLQDKISESIGLEISIAKSYMGKNDFDNLEKLTCFIIRVKLKNFTKDFNIYYKSNESIKEAYNSIIAQLTELPKLKDNEDYKQRVLKAIKIKIIIKI